MEDKVKVSSLIMGDLEEYIACYGLDDDLICDVPLTELNPHLAAELKKHELDGAYVNKHTAYLIAEKAEEELAQKSKLETKEEDMKTKFKLSGMPDFARYYHFTSSFDTGFVDYDVRFEELKESHQQLLKESNRELRYRTLNQASERQAQFTGLSPTNLVEQVEPLPRWRHGLIEVPAIKGPHPTADFFVSEEVLIMRKYEYLGEDRLSIQVGCRGYEEGDNPNNWVWLDEDLDALYVDNVEVYWLPLPTYKMYAPKEV